MGRVDDRLPTAGEALLLGMTGLFPGGQRMLFSANQT